MHAGSIQVRSPQDLSHQLTGPHVANTLCCCLQMATCDFGCASTPQQSFSAAHVSLERCSLLSAAASQVLHYYLHVNTLGQIPCLQVKQMVDLYFTHRLPTAV